MSVTIHYTCDHYPLIATYRNFKALSVSVRFHFLKNIQECCNILIKCVHIINRLLDGKLMNKHPSNTASPYNI